MKFSLHNAGLVAGLLAITTFVLSGQARAHDTPHSGQPPAARFLQPVHQHRHAPPHWLRHYYRHHHRPWWRHGYYDKHMLRKHYRHMKRRHYRRHWPEPAGSYFFFEYRY